MTNFFFVFYEFSNYFFARMKSELISDGSVDMYFLANFSKTLSAWLGWASVATFMYIGKH